MQNMRTTYIKIVEKQCLFEGNRPHRYWAVSGYREGKRGEPLFQFAHDARTFEEAQKMVERRGRAARIEVFPIQNS